MVSKNFSIKRIELRAGFVRIDDAFPVFVRPAGGTDATLVVMVFLAAGFLAAD